jgi:hypothetical protein
MRGLDLRASTLLAAAAALLLSGLSACGEDAPASGDDGGTIIGDTGDDTGFDLVDPDAGDEPDESAGDVASDGADAALDGDTGAPDLTEDQSGDPDVGAPDLVVDMDIPEQWCRNDEDCVDSLACTVGRCAENHFCEWTVAAGQCLVNGVCYGAGTTSPLDPCEVCTPTTDQLAFSPKLEGAACDDADLCTLSTTCQAGECVGIEVTCDDGDECTRNLCDPAVGCTFPPAPDGLECDDGSLCTSDTICLGGICRGTELDCADGDPCTDDVCDPETGCENPYNTAPCEDGDLCTVGDACSEGECLAGGPRNCEDGNICTFDLCLPATGCYNLVNESPCCVGTVSFCDDSNPCTNDLCDPSSGACDVEYNSALCNDDDYCTLEDSCSEGECTGTPRDCDDGNPCTVDSCSSGARTCVHRPLDGAPCDDGIACTTEVCDSGACVIDASECTCVPVLSTNALKAISLQIGNGGHPGEGLDLDGDPSTCTPRTNCSGGINNALGILASFANEELVGALAAGDVILLVELRNFTLNPVEFALHTGELAPSNPDCDIQADRCDYLIESGGLDSECNRVISLPGTRSGNRIFAGGPGTIFPFEVPLGDDTLTIVLNEVRFEGTLVEEAGSLVSMSGVLGGAVRRATLLAALESLDPESLPIDPADIANILNILVVDDIDTDGNGTPDAASIGIKLSGIRANLVGVEE